MVNITCVRLSPGPSLNFFYFSVHFDVFELGTLFQSLCTAHSSSVAMMSQLPTNFLIVVYNMARTGKAGQKTLKLSPEHLVTCTEDKLPTIQKTPIQLCGFSLTDILLIPISNLHQCIISSHFNYNHFNPMPAL